MGGEFIVYQDEGGEWYWQWNSNKDSSPPDAHGPFSTVAAAATDMAAVAQSEGL
jgi:hypothetical protein